jgi:hypothetical protein
LYFASILSVDSFFCKIAGAGAKHFVSDIFGILVFSYFSSHKFSNHLISSSSGMRAPENRKNI